MKADLWMTESGQAKIAAGREPDYCDLGLSNQGLNMETQGWSKIDTLIISSSQLPGREECIRMTLERLSEQERALRERHNEDLARIEQMRSEMLSLEMAPAKSQPLPESDDGFPF